MKKEQGFIKVPKVLLTENYRHISAEAKLLYIVLLDLSTLSEKNGLTDERGTYVYYSIRQAQELLRCGHDKAGRIYRELENAGLVLREKQGFGKADRIYPQYACSRIRKEGAQKSEKQISGDLKNGAQERVKPDTINTEDIHTEDIYTQSIHLDGWVDRIREQIDYSLLAEKYDAAQLDEIVFTMADVMCATEPTLRINHSNADTTAVQARFSQLDFTHIEYVLTCLRSNTREITNVRAYLMTVLYNASSTITTYYQAQINHNEAC